MQRVRIWSGGSLEVRRVAPSSAALPPRPWRPYVPGLALSSSDCTAARMAVAREASGSQTCDAAPTSLTRGSAAGSFRIRARRGKSSEKEVPGARSERTAISARCMNALTVSDEVNAGDGKRSDTMTKRTPHRSDTAGSITVDLLSDRVCCVNCRCRRRRSPVASPALRIGAGSVKRRLSSINTRGCSVLSRVVALTPVRTLP